MIVQAHPFRRRLLGIEANDWTLWKVQYVLAGMPRVSRSALARKVRIPRNAIYDWMAGRRRFGRRRLARLDGWCRRLLPR